MPYGYGTVFEVAASSSTITTLASFNGTNGGYSYGSLVEDGNGNLFGTTKYGGVQGDGTVFELAAGSGTKITLASFDLPRWSKTDGRTGRGQQRQSLRHHVRWRHSNDGTVYEVNTSGVSSRSNTALASFTGTDGAYPYGGLVEDRNGNLFGTTHQCRRSGLGLRGCGRQRHHHHARHLQRH